MLTNVLETARFYELEQFAERHDLEVVVSVGDQREPENVIALRTSAGRFVLRETTTDSIVVALARVEQTLSLFKRLVQDEYVQNRHSEWGQA